MVLCDAEKYEEELRYDTVDNNNLSDFSFNLFAVRSIREINIEILTKRLDRSKG